MPRPPCESVPRRHQDWSMAKVYQQCRSAIIVWAALKDMADAQGSSHLTPTRTLLSNLSGIRDHDTISKALNVLAEARWIEKETLPVTEAGKVTARVYRITLIRKPLKTRTIELARIRSPYAGTDQALPMPEPTGHSGPDKPGIAMPGPTQHEPSFGRHVASTLNGVAADVRVPQREFDNLQQSKTPEPLSSALASAVMIHFAPWSPKANQELWRSLERHAKAQDACMYTEGLQKVLELLGLKPTDETAIASVIQLFGIDRPTHDKLFLSFPAPGIHELEDAKILILSDCGS